MPFHPSIDLGQITQDKYQDWLLKWVTYTVINFLCVATYICYIYTCCIATIHMVMFTGNPAVLTKMCIFHAHSSNIMKLAMDNVSAVLHLR